MDEIRFVCLIVCLSVCLFVCLFACLTVETLLGPDGTPGCDQTQTKCSSQGKKPR